MKTIAWCIKQPLYALRPRAGRFASSTQQVLLHFLFLIAASLRLAVIGNGSEYDEIYELEDTTRGDTRRIGLAVGTSCAHATCRLRSDVSPIGEKRRIEKLRYHASSSAIGSSPRQRPSNAQCSQGCEPKMNAAPAISQPPEDPRVRLAGERTLLAWVRTGLAMMGFGFVVARFGLFLRELSSVGRAIPPQGQHWSLWIGNGLIVLAVVMILLASFEHRQFLARLDARLDYQPPRRSLALIVAAVLSGIGLLLVVYLAFVAR